MHENILSNDIVSLQLCKFTEFQVKPSDFLFLKKCIKHSIMNTSNYGVVVILFHYIIQKYQ